MAKEQGLKTLGDYRRVAKDSLFNYGVFPKNKSTSFYDATKTALVNCNDLIISSRSDSLLKCVWDGISFPKPNYAMRNLHLFNSIKLMEFAIKYKNGEESFSKSASKWPFRPNVNAMVFTSAGVSYLEATFIFVSELGRSIILRLQNAYKKHTKEGNIIYRDPFKFLNETRTVDELEINPVPDIVIKTWFDLIIEGIKEDFPENEFSKQKLEAEFNKTHRQLGYERDIWENGNGKAGDTPVTLREFIKEYCVTVSQNILESRVKSLQGLVQKKKVTLQHTGDWIPGQSKKFLPSYLKVNWETYRAKLASLPELKRP